MIFFHTNNKDITIDNVYITILKLVTIMVNLKLISADELKNEYIIHNIFVQILVSENRWC